MGDYAGQTDEQLITLLQNNNEAAFTELYNRYWEKLLVVASNKLGDLLLSEELVQDIFLDIWNRRHSLHFSVKTSTYLAAALKYKVIDARAKRTRIQQQQQELVKHQTLADYSTENQLRFDELLQRLATLVAELPDKCQLVYKLSKEDGLSQKSIAEKLNISEKTVESHLSRAVKNLKSGLQLFFIRLSSTHWGARLFR